MIIKDKILLFWTIGKRVYENRGKQLDIVEKSSNYYSYLFGNSFMFTRENIWFMENLYKTFPVFFKELNYLSWNQHKYLLQITDLDERYFYFNITMFFKYNYEETKLLLENNYYKRI